MEGHKEKPPWRLDSWRAIEGMARGVMLFLVCVCERAQAPKQIQGLVRSGFGVPQTSAAALSMLDTPVLVRNWLSQATQSVTREQVIILGKLT